MSLGDRQTYSAGDVDRMLGQIDSFCNDAKLADEVGRMNQSHVRKHFSLPAMVDAYRNHYRLILAERVDER